MNARVLDAVSLLVLLIPSLCMALTCLQCTDVPVPRDCGKVKTCGSHEVCFIDEYVIASGHIRYSVGCRDSRFCISSGRRSADESHMNTDNHTVLTDHNILRKSPNGDMTQSNNDVMVRSSGNVKLCESCCNTDLCNNGGCAASGYVPRHGRGPICYTCAQQRTPGSCDSISVCGQNSVCKIKLDAHLTTGDVFYSTKCEDPQVCHQDAVFQNMIVGRKRLTEEVNTLCDLPMGIENPLLVKDTQLSASSSLDIVHGAERGRLYAMKDGSYSGGWVPKENDQKQYIQVDFLAPYQIAGVMTQGRYDAPEWVTKYEVYYSTDGKHYTAVPKSSTDSSPMLFTGNFDQNTPVKHMFDLITARWIRIHPVDWKNNIGLRFNVLGCSAPSLATVTIATTKTVTPTPTPASTVFPPVTATTCAYWTPWVSASKPDTVGEYETAWQLRNMVSFCDMEFVTMTECRTVGTHIPYDQAGEENVVCNNDIKGVVCFAQNQTDGSCLDYEIRVFCDECSSTTSSQAITPRATTHNCNSRWLPWVNKMIPTTDIDYIEHELMTKEELQYDCWDGHITRIECETTSGIPQFSAGFIGSTCDIPTGLTCKNADNIPVPCEDFKVRYYCDCYPTHKCIVKCCDVDLCNGQCGTGSVLGTSGSGTSGNTDPCVSNPCVYGSCSVYQGNYACTCRNGATGRNCDILHSPCDSNPCVHGSCHSSGISYQCHCNNGYTGTNCDHAHNPCDSNPCVYGTCHSHGTSYQCQCTSGYTGTNCDHVVDPCSSYPCLHGRCISSDSTYTCQCFDGFTGPKCEQTVDYCASSPCGPGDCHISGYTFKCTCYPGWTGTRCHQYIGTVSHNCATGWLKHGSSCYLFKKEKQSWTSSKSLCSSQGAYLAEVNDGTEQHFLVQEGPVAHKGDWWIGGVHNNGRWQWDHSRHDISGGYWDSHFPRSHGGACIELHKVSSGAWRNEDSCSHENYYVCEKAEWLVLDLVS